MTGIIASGNWGKALLPGVNSFWGKYYNETNAEWKDLFDVFNSRKAFEEDVGATSMGLAAVKSEGAPVTYDSDAQSYITRYSHLEYALGYIITKIMLEDDLYDVAAEKRTRMLAFSMSQTKENVGANVYNRAFSSSYPGGDGVSILNAAHPLKSGGTQSNILAVASTLSEAALEQARIDILRFKNDRGHFANLKPGALIVPPELEADAMRILRAEKRVGTASNDPNALRMMAGSFSKVAVNRFLTSTTAWFVRTNAPDGMKHFVRRAMEFTMDNDFDTDNAKYKASERYSFGCSDFRGIYGTPGI